MGETHASVLKLRLNINMSEKQTPGMCIRAEREKKTLPVTFTVDAKGH